MCGADIIADMCDADRVVYYVTLGAAEPGVAVSRAASDRVPVATAQLGSSGGLRAACVSGSGGGSKQFSWSVGAGEEHGSVRGVCDEAASGAVCAGLAGAAAETEGAVWRAVTDRSLEPVARAGSILMVPAPAFKHPKFDRAMDDAWHYATCAGVL